MIIHLMDIIATFVFAVSGGFRAVKHELDLLGVLVLSTATGIGGGVIRDIIFGTTPPLSFRDENYLLVCILAGLTVFLIAPRIARRWDMVLVADAVGLGLFSAIGAEKAFTMGLGPVGIMLSAAITATGGGIIRDILVREIPDVLHTDFYATASIAGGALFYLSVRSGTGSFTSFVISVVFTISLRLIAMYAGLKLPKVRRLPDSPSELTKKHKRSSTPKE